jgi:hypothetical protein
LQTRDKIHKGEKKEKISQEKIEKLFKGKSIAKFFGIDPTGVDGLAYQKKVRSEWD